MDLDLLVKREHLTGLELPGKTLYSLPVLKALLSNHIISLPGIASLHPQIIKFTQTRWLRMEAGGEGGASLDVGLGPLSGSGVRVLPPNCPSHLPHRCCLGWGGTPVMGRGKRRARGFLGDRAWQERLPWQPGRTGEFGK